MTVAREFLGWDAGAGPPLERACAWIIERFGGFDLSKVLIITPGGRAGRLLEGMLIDRAQAETAMLAPPVLSTPGEMPSAILRPQGRFAEAIHRRLAWMRALAASRPLRTLLPGTSDVRSDMAIAGALDGYHRELIGEGLRFEDVASRLEKTGAEADRWREAALVQAHYIAELASAGLVDEGIAVLRALDEGIVHVRHVVLVGVPELSEVAARILDLPGVEATALIFAPEELRDGFDSAGCVRTEAWRARHIPVDDRDIIFANDPGDQARRVMEVLAGLGGSYSAHDITVGVPDESVVPHLRRAAERFAGVEARHATGSPIATSTVYQLLAAMERLLEEDTFEALSDLARQPDLERYLLRSFRQSRLESWLSNLDRYCVDHLPGSGALTAPNLSARESIRRSVEQLQKAVRQLLEPLASASRVKSADLLDVMRRVYAGASVSRDDQRAQDLVKASEKIAVAAGHLAELPASWQPATGAELIHLILGCCRDLRLPPERTAEALELLGWLELPLDPAPVAIVTGVNDDSLPGFKCADAMLPDSLRARLSIDCSDRRLARDTFLLTMLAHSRRAIKLICGKRGADGDPLKPSRLLFAADDQAVVRRVRMFCGDGPTARPVIRPRRALGGRDLFPRLPIVEVPAVNSMSVTSFRTFICSPYLFYLQHVLKLREHEDPEPELSPRIFGEVIHRVVARFGASDARDFTDERQIRECLVDFLTSEAAQRFGREPSPAIAVQIEMARLRLTEFAQWQAAHRRGGWRIIATELEVEQAPLPGMTDFFIRGTIDRIDSHETHGVAILDYKTGDNVQKPNATHVRSGRWIDLQLPLYRHLAAQHASFRPDALTLGYIPLPARPGNVELLSAGWTLEQLASADAAACDIAAKVRDGKFQELGESPAEEGAFAALIGTALGSRGSAAQAPGGEPNG